MASAPRDGDDHLGSVEFVREDDGSITARDLETGLARGGDTRAEALSQLAEVLALEAGEGEPVTEDDLDEWEINSDDFDDKELPEFVR